MYWHLHTHTQTNTPKYTGNESFGICADSNKEPRRPWLPGCVSVCVRERDKRHQCVCVCARALWLVDACFGMCVHCNTSVCVFLYTTHVLCASCPVSRVEEPKQKKQKISTNPPAHSHLPTSHTSEEVRPWTAAIHPPVSQTMKWNTLKWNLQVSHVILWGNVKYCTPLYHKHWNETHWNEICRCRMWLCGVMLNMAPPCITHTEMKHTEMKRNSLKWNLQVLHVMMWGNVRYGTPLYHTHWNETHWNETHWNEICRCRMWFCVVMLDMAPPRITHWNETHWNEMKHTEMKRHTLKWNLQVPHVIMWGNARYSTPCITQLKWNTLKWNETHWYEMRQWNTLKWNMQVPHVIMWGNAKYGELGFGAGKKS